MTAAAEEIRQLGRWPGRAALAHRLQASARMKHIKLLGVAAALLVPAAVYAGARMAVEVTITLDETTGAAIGAQGNEADAYNSADANQYIGCGGAATAGFCQAHDASADADGLINSAFCSTTDPTLIAHIRSVAADSFVHFTVDQNTGECLSISVSHNSFYRPKAP